MGGAHACILEILHCNRVPPIRSSYLTVRAGAKAVLLFCFVLVLLLKVKREMDEYQYIYQNHAYISVTGNWQGY